MDLEEIRQQFQPAIDEILTACCVSDSFVDKDQFRIYIATIWGNAAIDPVQSGVPEGDLSLLHDFLNEEIRPILGNDENIITCYEYLSTKDGEEAMQRLKLTKRHKEFIAYFARIILT